MRLGSGAGLGQERVGARLPGPGDGDRRGRPRPALRLPAQRRSWRARCARWCGAESYEPLLPVQTRTADDRLRVARAGHQDVDPAGRRHQHVVAQQRQVGRADRRDRHAVARDDVQLLRAPGAAGRARRSNCTLRYESAVASIDAVELRRVRGLRGQRAPVHRAPSVLGIGTPSTWNCSAVEALPLPRQSVCAAVEPGRRVPGGRVERVDVRHRGVSGRGRRARPSRRAEQRRAPRGPLGGRLRRSGPA